MAEEIRFTNDRSEITALWAAVFKDSESDISFFLDNCLNKRCLALYSDSQLASMLFLVECAYCGKKGAYIYAVSTYERFRRRGFAGRLIEYAKTLGCDFLWLIPANESLFDYYAKFGFKTLLFSDMAYDNRVVFNESSEICGYLYDGSDFKEPRGMLFSEEPFEIGSTGIYELRRG